MKRICLALLFVSALWLSTNTCTAAPIAAADQVYGVIYGGGNVPYAESDLWIGMSVDSTSTTFYVSQKLKHHKFPAAKVGEYFAKHPDRAQAFAIPSSSINSISLSQDKHHRVGTGIAVSVISLGAGIPIMFTKSTKDYIEITWDDKGQKGAAEFQADKRDYRALLTALSGASGVLVTAAVDTQGKK